jgi:predicted DsbA family dithiol-disulfide isomerase
LGLEVGLSADPSMVLQSYANEVQHDIDEAQSIGVQGVPFFVLIINIQYRVRNM